MTCLTCSWMDAGLRWCAFFASCRWDPQLTVDPPGKWHFFGWYLSDLKTFKILHYLLGLSDQTWTQYIQYFDVPSRLWFRKDKDDWRLDLSDFCYDLLHLLLLGHFFWGVQRLAHRQRHGSELFQSNCCSEILRTGGAPERYMGPWGALQMAFSLGKWWSPLINHKIHIYIYTYVIHIHIHIYIYTIYSFLVPYFHGQTRMVRSGCVTAHLRWCRQLGGCAPTSGAVGAKFPIDTGKKGSKKQQTSKKQHLQHFQIWGTRLSVQMQQGSHEMPPVVPGTGGVLEQTYADGSWCFEQDFTTVTWISLNFS